MKVYIFRPLDILPKKHYDIMEKAVKKRSTYQNPDREDCPPVESQSREVGTEGSFGAGFPNVRNELPVGSHGSSPLKDAMRTVKEADSVRQMSEKAQLNKGGTASDFALCIR